MIPSPTVSQQGLGAVSGDLLNTFVQNVATVSQLRGFAGRNAMVITLQGYYSPGDGGQGNFVYNSNSTAADNGTTVIRPTSVTVGAWLRLNQGSGGGGGLPSVGSFGFVDPTGVSDSSPGFLAAIASGQSFFIPPGAYIIDSPLLLTSENNAGQMIVGSGVVDGAGGGLSKTVLKPGASVTALFTIDGASFSGYVQGVVLSDFAIDMSLMPSNAVAVLQKQAFDISSNNLRVLNSNVSAGQVAWQFNPGAYTTCLTNLQGGRVYINGNGVNDPTTITLINCDIDSIQGQYAANITLVGGAIQPVHYSGMTVDYVAAGSGNVGNLPLAAPTTAASGTGTVATISVANGLTFPVGQSIVVAGMTPSGYNGTHTVTASSAGSVSFASATTGAQTVAGSVSIGMYAVLVGYLTSINSFTVIGTDFEQGGGYPSTYNDGTHGTFNAYPVFLINNTCADLSWVNAQFAGMYLWNNSSSNILIGYQPGGGGGGNFIQGPLQFDGTVYLNNSQAIRGYAGDRYGSGVQSLLLDASTGGANLQYAAVKPASDQTCFVVENAAGTTLLAVNTVSGAQTFLNGATGFAMYSDNSSTNLVFGVNGATGLMRGYDASQVNTVQMTPVNGTFTCTTGLYTGATVAGAVQVVGRRQTGWGAASGTLSRTAYAAYTGQTYTGSYVQATAQATDNALKTLSQTVAALITDLTTHGLIGA